MVDWNIVLQLVIAVILIVVAAVGNSIATKFGNVQRLLESNSKGIDRLMEVHDSSDLLDSLGEILKCMRRQVHFDNYQRGVNNVVMTKLEVPESKKQDLEAPSE